MVKLHSSEMFIKDPADVWGNEQTIGLAELAARMHAPPMTFARAGNVLFWDNFESSTPKFWGNATNAGTIGRSNLCSEYDDFSAEGITDATAADYCEIHYRLTDFHDSKIGCQCAFTSSDDKYIIQAIIIKYDGTNYNACSIKWTHSTGLVEYRDSAGVYQSLSPTIKRYDALKNWSTIQVVADLSAEKYVSARVFNQEYDLSTLDWYSTPDATAPHADIFFRVTPEEAVAKTVYFDSVIIVENL